MMRSRWIQLLSLPLLLLLVAVMSGMIQPVQEAKSRSNHRLLRRGQSSETSTRITLTEDDPSSLYRVVMFMELKYMNDTTARRMEQAVVTTTSASSIPPNDLVAHFCQTVNLQVRACARESRNGSITYKHKHTVSNSFFRQATGNQVDNVAQVLDATIDTKILTPGESSPFPDYECRILDTNRAYDNDAEDTVGAGHFILEVAVEQLVYVTSNATLSLEQVTEAVETGFNRGSGGRVKFRSILKEHLGFASLITVEMLDGALSTPQVAPSVPPTISPSQAPSISPSSSPSTLKPSVLPSHEPSFAPSSFPSQGPTIDETVIPSTNRPSSNGVVSSTESSDKSSPKKRNLIIGAVVGGLVAILVSAFFIFCVWIPFCGREDDDERPVRGDPYVPGVVALNEGNESLANTTLGDPSLLGRNASKENLETSKTESFDDNSLYTNNNVAIFDTNDPSQQYFLRVLPIPLDPAEEYDDGIADPFEATESEDQGNCPVQTFQKPSITRILDEVADTIRFSPSDYECEPESNYPAIPPSRSNEEKANEISNRASLGSKGLDPFEDSSSYSSYNFEDTSGSDDESSNVNDMRVRNLIAGSFPVNDDVADPSSFSEGEKRETLNGIREDIESEHSTTESYDEIVQELPVVSRLSTNDLLLRSVLEGEGNLRRTSNRSRSSRQSRRSAPPTIYEERASLDILADTQDLGRLRLDSKRVSRSKRKKSSRSVGESTRHSDSYRGVLRDTRSLDDDTGTRTKKKSTGVLGARKGGALWEHLSKNSEVSSPEVSPGTLGISRNGSKVHATPSSSDTDGTTSPWLEGSIEQALGPRSSNADLESLSGRSTKSNTSQRSAKSSNSNAAYSIASRRSVKSSFSRTSHASNVSQRITTATYLQNDELPIAPSLSNEQKSDFDEEAATMPRSLEHDLHRLEIQLADVLKKHPPLQQNKEKQSTADDSGLVVATDPRPDSLQNRNTVVVAPPGKVGIVLANKNDGNGTIISEVRESSQLLGLLAPGDKLLAIDDQDVSELLVSQVISLMAAKSNRERKLTILSGESRSRSTNQEEKSASS